MPDELIFFAVALPTVGIVMMIHLESLKEKIRFASPNKEEANRILRQLNFPHRLRNIRNQLLEVCPEEGLIKSMVKWIRIYQVIIVMLMISMIITT